MRNLFGEAWASYQQTTRGMPLRNLPMRFRRDQPSFLGADMRRRVEEMAAANEDDEVEDHEAAEHEGRQREPDHLEMNGERERQRPTDEARQLESYEAQGVAGLVLRTGHLRRLGGTIRLDNGIHPGRHFASPTAPIGRAG